MMHPETAFLNGIAEAAAAFGYRHGLTIQPVGNGLINSTFLVTASGKEPLLLQKINRTVFQRPSDIQYNYQVLSEFLKSKNYFIPELKTTTGGQLLWESQHAEAWRAFQFIPGSLSPDVISSTTDAIAVAACFGRFAATLKELPAGKLKITLPGFHNLQWRYQQFEDALKTTQVPIEDKLKETIRELKQRTPLLSVVQRFEDERLFPLRLMHHDCKISNILFSEKTKDIICPVDLDTVMPGKFFSDLGDMVRTMCATVDENSTDWDAIAINEEMYTAVISAYRAQTDTLFTAAEKDHLHFSGLLLIYMQALRFLTDFLNGNCYYKVQYPEQNFHRARNQYQLLKSLETLLKKTS